MRDNRSTSGLRGARSLSIPMIQMIVLGSRTSDLKLLSLALAISMASETILVAETGNELDHLDIRMGLGKSFYQQRTNLLIFDEMCSLEHIDEIKKIAAPIRYNIEDLLWFELDKNDLPETPYVSGIQRKARVMRKRKKPT